MALLMNILWWIDRVLYFTWPVILVTYFVLRNFDPYARRMRRGRLYLWERRMLGPHAEFLICAIALPAVFVAVVLIGERWPCDFWWLYLAIGCVVDYITGGDEPGKRVKALASSLVKKLTIQPPPRPVIDLR